MQFDTEIYSGGVLELIFRGHPEIASMELVRAPEQSFCPYSDPNSEVDKLLPPHSDLLRMAHRLGTRRHIPFWDAVLSLALAKGIVSRPILDLALHHNFLEHVSFLTDADSVTKNIESFSRQYNPAMLAVRSMVILKDGSLTHIPMIDFHCPISPQNDRNVERIVYLLGMPGYLLNSGKSYHFYGERLLPPKEYHRFLGRALLFAPFVDRAWIAHQLMQDASVLRVSAQPKYKKPPVLISRYGP